MPSSGEIAQSIEWKNHYNMVLKRIFQDTHKTLILNNRLIYSNAIEKITRPCDKCGASNKYDVCESCAFSDFVTKTTKREIDSYIHRHLKELTEYIQIKAIKDGHRKALNSRISELKGKPIKKVEKEGEGDSEKSGRKRPPPEVTGEPMQIDSGVKRVARAHVDNEEE